MRKAGRIGVLLLSTIQVIWCILGLRRSIFLVVVYSNPIVKDYFTYALIDTIGATLACFLAIIYIAFTLKNGLGSELFGWSKEKYNIFLINKNQKQEEKKEKRKQKLQQKLDKLNTKENE